MIVFFPEFFSVMRVSERERERYGLIIQFLLSEFCNTQKKKKIAFFIFQEKYDEKNENSIYQEKKISSFFSDI